MNKKGRNNRPIYHFSIGASAKLTFPAEKQGLKAVKQ